MYVAVSQTDSSKCGPRATYSILEDLHTLVSIVQVQVYLGATQFHLDRHCCLGLPHFPIGATTQHEVAVQRDIALPDTTAGRFPRRQMRLIQLVSCWYQVRQAWTRQKCGGNCKNAKTWTRPSYWHVEWHQSRWSRTWLWPFVIQLPSPVWISHSAEGGEDVPGMEK